MNQGNHEMADGLTHYFIQVICQASNSYEDRYKHTYAQINQFLKEGMTDLEIKNIMDQFKMESLGKPISLYHIGEIPYFSERKNNLISPDENLYHNELLIQNESVRIKKNPDGTFEKIKPNFQGVYYKKIYTKNNLIDYFYKKMKFKQSELNSARLRRDLAKIDHMLENYSLQDLLFAIDASYRELVFINKPLFKDIFLIERYIEEGRDELSKKRNLHRQLKIKEII